MKKLFYTGMAVITLFGLLTFFGCISLTPKSYDFTENETNSASISFTGGNPRVSFINFNDYGLPAPEERTYWDPIVFPSGEPLEMTVHAYYYQEGRTATNAGLLAALLSTIITSSIAQSRSVDIDVLFLCPPLEPGKNYSLSFRKEAGTPGKNLLVLTDIAERKIIHKQEFE